MDINGLILITGILLASSLLIALGVAKIGLPSLVAFLLLGMLLGSDVLGVNFNNSEVAQIVGTIGLVLILFEGGLSTSWRRLKDVAMPAISLSTLGVLLTAILTGIAAYFIFDVPILYAALIGAVVSSTDAAAVFASMRSSVIKRRLARALEAESGLNDPMAIALTIGLISWISLPNYGGIEMVILLLKQLIIGLIFGLLLGRVSILVFEKLPHSMSAFAPVASLAICFLSFGITQFAGGSGFLSVYLVGLSIGSQPSRYRSQLTSFHEGIAFLAQVVMFITLGLLVNPADLSSIALRGFLLALLLALLIRPIAVWLSLSLSKFSNKERLFLGVAGLRGAVPIVLGTFVLSSGIDRSNQVFNIVFFVVLISALFQGAAIEKLARLLNLIDKINGPKENIENSNKKAYQKFIVSSSHAIVGSKISELGLPKESYIVNVKRGGNVLQPDQKIKIEIDDELKIAFPNKILAEVEDVVIRWRRRI